jgi:hypothetical protein
VLKKTLKLPASNKIIIGYSTLKINSLNQYRKIYEEIKIYNTITEEISYQNNPKTAQTKGLQAQATNALPKTTPPLSFSSQSA